MFPLTHLLYRANSVMPEYTHRKVHEATDSIEEEKDELYVKLLAKYRYETFRYYDTHKEKEVVEYK